MISMKALALVAAVLLSTAAYADDATTKVCDHGTLAQFQGLLEENGFLVKVTNDPAAVEAAQKVVHSTYDKVNPDAAKIVDDVDTALYVADPAQSRFGVGFAKAGCAVGMEGTEKPAIFAVDPRAGEKKGVDNRGA
jgi:hypothetical protein